MNIVFCSSEVFPFAKTGGLADVCGALPLAMEKYGHTISIYMPEYRDVRKSGYPVNTISETLSKTKLSERVQVYFVRNKKFFYREGLYGDSHGDFKDNIERFVYFCQEVLSAIKLSGQPCDIIHCHDWQSALIPVYLKELHAEDLFFGKTKSLLTIHNLAFQGIFHSSQYEKIGLDERLFSPEFFEFYGQVNLFKAGIIAADGVNTVSEKYAREILTKEFGCGLEGVIRSRRRKVFGVLNGLDETLWNPLTDKYIYRHYSLGDCTRGKESNKKQLQKAYGLNVEDQAPLAGFVGRLSQQKGVDLILESLLDMVQMGFQIFFLGVGDSSYQEKIANAARQYPGQVAACFKFNEPLGHQIYAGSDFFLIPSRFEPCGLSQMISLNYGTIPIARKTGGLADTIKPCGVMRKGGNGFFFSSFTKRAFLRTVSRAGEVFCQKNKLQAMRANGLRADFSWDHSARLYQKIYQDLLDEVG